MSSKNDSQRTSDDMVITEAQIESVLRRVIGDEAELKSWEIEESLATYVRRIKVSYISNEKENTTSYIVKLNKDTAPEGFKSFVEVLYKKEKEFYEQILPALNSELTGIGQQPLRVPTYVYSATEDGRELMIFEDLRLQGFKTMDLRKGMNAHHAVLVLQELARLHAASFLLQERYHEEDLSDRYPFLKVNWHNHSEEAEELFSNLFSDHFEHTIDMLQKIGGYEVAKDWLAEHKASSVEVFKRLIIRQTPFDVICHGDCWNNNILFRYGEDGNPSEIMFVDLEVSRQASLATDLNYFMFTTLAADVRRNNITDLLTSYYKAFRVVTEASGRQTPFTPENLHREYRNKGEFGLLFALDSIGIVLKPPEKTPDSDNTEREEESNDTADGKGNNPLFNLDKNPKFRPRFLALFDDTINYGITK